MSKNCVDCGLDCEAGWLICDSCQKEFSVKLRAGMKDIAKEEQERILAENEKWYGQRYHTEQAETHRSLSTDIEGHWK